MRALIDDKWLDGFLDYHRAGNECRIEVRAWRNLEKLEDLYFERDRSARLLWNYLREVGPGGVWRKVRSRRQEHRRNAKFVSCGVGRVTESADPEHLPPGRAVAFLAPAHPACVERCVLPAPLLRPIEDEALPELHAGALLYLGLADAAAPRNRSWNGLAGWSPYSGHPITSEAAEAAMSAVEDLLREAPWGHARALKTFEHGEPRERAGRGATHDSGERKRAVLFGHGHYAKTMILPYLKPYLRVDRIHEIDPMQIPGTSEDDIAWDTSPDLRPDDNHDVVLIAGYHHTHVPVAISALRRGAYAVVEKPIAVDESQLAELLQAMRTFDGRLFVGFQRRYLPFNAYAREDLGLHPGDPLSYHCIIYEEPLPARHWYRWPNAKSRLVSNGCHWIDHFLYLNDFAKPKSWEVAIGPDDTINCSVTLSNGAFFTMVLTEQGSNRIGLQDYVELRANGATAQIINGSAYRAENGERVVRKVRINRLASYKAMYEHIGRTIAKDGAGEPAGTVAVSSELVLALEREFRDKKAKVRSS